MLSNPISTKVIFALALAILMAWAGHPSALFMGSSQPALGGNDGAHSHSHSHGDETLACAAYGDHCHSPLTADHLHETPHLTALLSIVLLLVTVVRQHSLAELRGGVRKEAAAAKRKKTR